MPMQQLVASALCLAMLATITLPVITSGLPMPPLIGVFPATVSPANTSPAKLSRTTCDVAYHTPAWFDSWSDYSPLWFEADNTIRVLQKEHLVLAKAMQSSREVRSAASLKWNIRHLQKKNQDLYKLIESFAPTPGMLCCKPKDFASYKRYKTLRRNVLPLKQLSKELWVGLDQY
jgi:hypothetical protein